MHSFSSNFLVIYSTAKQYFRHLKQFKNIVDECLLIYYIFCISSSPSSAANHKFWLPNSLTYSSNSYMCECSVNCRQFYKDRFEVAYGCSHGLIVMSFFKKHFLKKNKHNVLQIISQKGIYIKLICIRIKLKALIITTKVLLPNNVHFFQNVFITWL